jgi:hypothetical protein
MANSRQPSDPSRAVTHCSDAGTTFFDPSDSIADTDINSVEFSARRMMADESHWVLQPNLPGVTAEVFCLDHFPQAHL